MLLLFTSSNTIYKLVGEPPNTFINYATTLASDSIFFSFLSILPSGVYI